MSITKGNNFLPGVRKQPLSSAIVKGVKMQSVVEKPSDLRKINFILRRRHLGILDEQTLMKKMDKHYRTGMGRHGIENYFATEFTSRSAPGFQCVARKRSSANTGQKQDSILQDDFKVEYDEEHNAFKYKIVLRHIPSSDVENVIAATKNVQTNGFLNYYYGSEFFNSHVRQGLLPGLHLLLGQYAAAFELLCNAPRILRQSITQHAQEAEKDLFGGSSSSNESMDAVKFGKNKSRITKMLRRYSDEDIENQSALARKLQQHKPIELTDALCKHTLESVYGVGGCDVFIGEFVAIVWNEALSRRVRQFGARAIVDGDLVLDENDDDNNKKKRLEGDVVQQLDENENNSDINQIVPMETALEKENVSKSVITSINDIHTFRLKEIVAHRQHQDAKLDVSHVLLPTLGKSTFFASTRDSWKDFTVGTLKQYSIQEDFDEFDEQDDGANNEGEEEVMAKNINSCQNVFPSLKFDEIPLWHFEGEYRRMIEYPQKFSWKLSPDEELTETELGFVSEKRKKMENDSWSQASSSSSSSSSLVNIKNDLQTSFNSSQIINGSVTSSPASAGMLHKLEMTFSLPPFVSPWMMLREMCKMERHIFDEGLRTSGENREERVNLVEAEKAAVRRRIYKRIQRKWSLIPAPGRAPPQIESATMMASIFTTSGVRSLFKNPSGRKDVYN